MNDICANTLKPYDECNCPNHRSLTPTIRTFTSYRKSDQSGVSGTGIVLQGAIYPSGQCIVQWLTPEPGGSINIFSSFKAFMDIHVNPHPTNKTIITFNDGESIEG